MMNNTRIPAWLLTKNEFENADLKSGKTRFISKTLHHFAEVIENEFMSELFASKPMMLQVIDARVKIIVLLAFMLFSAISSNVIILLALAIIAMIYAKLSGLDIKDYIRRVWFYIPLIVLIFSIPAASSLFVKGTPLFYILNPEALGIHSGVYFSTKGIIMALRLALRSGMSLSYAFLLLLTTRWVDVTGALSAMRIPKLFVSILDMAYRYIFTIVETANAMIEARFMRTVGKLKQKDNRNFVGRTIALLFMKSFFLSEETYDAMRCRGFSGEPVSITFFKMKAADGIFIVNNILIILVLIVGERLF